MAIGFLGVLLFTLPPRILPGSTRFKPSKQWKRMGIFDLIQLSWVPIWYNTPMLWASFYFFNKTTNNFYFPYGKLSPTLFDFVAIVSLVPTANSLIPFTFLISNSTLSPNHCHTFVENNYKKSTSKVLASKHITFLWFWLNAFVFCTKSLQVQKVFYIWPPWSMRSMNFALVNSYCLTSTLPLLRLSTPSRIRIMLPVWGVSSGFSNYGLMPCWKVKWHIVLEMRCKSSLILVAFDCLAYHILWLITPILKSSFISSNSLGTWHWTPPMSKFFFYILTSWSPQFTRPLIVDGEDIQA